MNPFWSGILAGYGIAVPVGAIAVLIVETGLRRGFKGGFAAGAGAATADIVYAFLAAIAGEAIAAMLAPAATLIHWLSAGVLIFLGGWGLWQLAKRSRTGPASPGVVAAAETPPKIYTKFVGLTFVNPLTVTYFTALILGGGSTSPGWTARLAFILGAGLASLSWQTLLAGLGSLAHRHLSPRFQAATSLVGNLIVIGLGLRMLF